MVENAVQAGENKDSLTREPTFPMITGRYPTKRASAREKNLSDSKHTKQVSTEPTEEANINYKFIPFHRIYRVLSTSNVHESDRLRQLP